MGWGTVRYHPLVSNKVPARESLTYSIGDAARLAKTSPQNVRRWLFGYSAPGHAMRPVLGTRNDQPRLSFLDLVEIVVIARFRAGSGDQIPLARLRAAHAFARERLGIPHPFASGRFRVEGGHILHEFESTNPGPGTLAVDAGGNYVLPIELGEALSLFDFDDADGLAERWYPFGKHVAVVVDPEHAAGQPVMTNSNVRIETLRERWHAGQTIAELADDFELDASSIEHALQAA